MTEILPSPDPDFPPEEPELPATEDTEPDPEQPVVDGWTDAPVPGDRVDVHLGPLVAGDPLGARVEVTATGLHAYDATGTETATIQGEGGEFVGGSFRTSDNLPGQVTMSDTAANGGPGIEIAPVNALGYATFPHVAPAHEGVSISGGVSTLGDSSSVYANPANAGVLSESADGGQSRVQVSPTIARLRRMTPDGSTGEIAVYPGFTVMEYQHDSVARSLNVDANGVWVQTGDKSYNLEETAQDSGWQTITLDSGITGAGSPAWRNKGGMIYFRGTATATWVQGWNTVATGLPVEMRPAVRVIQNAPSQSELGLLWRMGSDGLLEFYKPTAGTRTGELSGLFYPLG